MYYIIPTWSSLRGVGSSWPSRLSVLIPILGFVIINHNITLSILQKYIINCNLCSELIELQLGIYLLYVGLFIFGVGSAIFQLGCAAEIKKFASAGEYVIALKDSIDHRDAILKLTKISQSADVDEDIRSEARHLLKISRGGTVVNSDGKIFCLNNYYLTLNLRFLLARLISFIFMATGIILCIIPSIINFVKVIIIIVSRLAGIK